MDRRNLFAAIDRLAASPLTLKGEKALRHAGSRRRDGANGAVSLLAVLLVAIAVSSLLDAPRARAFPQKLTPDDYYPAFGYGDMAVVDVNGDGLEDVVLSERAAPGGNGTFYVYLHNPLSSGYTMDSAVRVPEHRRMIVDDLNGDGRADVIILAVGENLIPECPGTVCIYLQPLGGFRGMRFATYGIATPGAIDIAAGELDGVTAGHDIAVLYPDKAMVYLAQPSSPLYEARYNQTLLDSVGYTRALVEDVDSDGTSDLVLANPNEIKVFYGKAGQIPGDCRANCMVYAIPGGQTGNVSIALGDVSSDSRLYMVVVISDATKSSGTIVILGRTGDPLLWNFTEMFRIDSRDPTDQIALGDFDGDGLNDIATIFYWDGSVAVFYRGMDGTFVDRVNLRLNGTAANGRNEFIGHGDIDDDGLEDIVLRSPTSISFFYQEDEEVQPSAIPNECPKSCHYFNQGESGDNLIDLSDYFTDDHGPIVYEVTYQESANLVATIDADGHHLDFTATPGWFGVARFRISANDLYLRHQPIESNEFAVMVNHAPAIVSTPPAQVSLGDEYTYLPVVDDPPAVAGHEDSYTFSVESSAPIGLSMDVNSGLLRWRPTSIGNFTITIQVTDNWGAKSALQTFMITVVPGPNESLSDLAGIQLPGGMSALTVIAVVASILLVFSGVLTASENMKYGLFLMLIPLYSKIKREKVLDHFIRGQIYGYIMANPGEHYNAIKQALDITNGSLAHHLRTLEREHFIQSKRFGLYRRFYPWAMRVPEDGYFRLNEIQKNVLALCKNQPGISQKDLSSSLNLTPPTINYHIAILAEHGYVSVIRRGRKTQVYLLRGAEDEAHRQVPH